MKAVGVVPRTREVTLVDVDEPALRSPTDVKLRVLEVGVCGTDREICAFEYGTPPPGCEHLVLGHESLAEVVEIGPAVSRVAVGDLVVPTIRRPCPHARCVACRSGRQDFCVTGDISERGIKEAHGFMTALAVDDEEFLVPVPRRLREVGVLVETLTVTEKAIDQLGRIQSRLPWSSAVEPGGRPGDGRRAVVLGAGPVGLLAAMALASGGFEVWVYSREPESSVRAGIARSIGARYVSTAIGAGGLADMAGQIDLVYEAAGAPEVSFELLAHMGANGVFIFTGVPPRRRPYDVDTDVLRDVVYNLVLANQVVLGTVNADRASFEAAVRDLGAFLDRWPGAVRALITGRFPMEACRELLLERGGGIKSVIAIGE